MASVEQTVHMGVPMPASLRKRLQAVADRNDRSAAAEVRLALTAHLEAQERQEAA